MPNRQLGRIRTSLSAVQPAGFGKGAHHGDEAELYAAAALAKPRRGFRMQRFVDRAVSRPSDHARPKPPRRLHSSRGLLRAPRADAIVPARSGRGPRVLLVPLCASEGKATNDLSRRVRHKSRQKNSLKTNEARWKTCVQQSRHRGRLRLSTPASKATRCLPRTEISPNLRY